ncbi:MAG: GTP diphosphokinase [Proteobacteria bacterium SW_6_67_9]|nr:MAG: GTP diphosphokinase [Proteobacteria bacterium SW_6_67_9]
MVEAASKHRVTRDTSASRVARLIERHPDARAALEAAAAAAQTCPPDERCPDGLGVASLLDELGVDSVTVTAALLSPPELERAEPREHLAARYGDTIAELVRNARWLNAFRAFGPGGHDRQPAERLPARLRLIQAEPREVRRRVADETLQLYAPLANRLGVSRLKWEMEDLAFRYLEPETYKAIADGLAARRADREQFIQQFIDELQRALAADGLEAADVFGRPKHIYSIWRKMQRKGVRQSELFDVEAVRVLVDRVRDCYSVLGAIHSRWQHIPQEFDDYIANPKDNGYQSLHTAVFGANGRPIEVQIRTHAMNEHAERGVAAHWLYKEGTAQGERLQESVNALRSLLDHGGGEGIGETFGRELFADRVFVFTPQGDVVDLPQGATALDFAFQIHTDVGYRCRGAKANGRIVPLTHSLRNGDQVEVLTTREPKPSRDWLNRDLGYLRTSRARAKVRAWFNQQDHAQHVAEGRELLERTLKRLNAREIGLDRLTRQLGYRDIEAVYIALGRNELTSHRIAQAVQAITRPSEAPPTTSPRGPGPASEPGGESVSVSGVGDLLTRMAACCQPVPGDAVIGYITRGRGVTVHRQDCPNVLKMDEDERARLIDVDWGGDDAQPRWSVDLAVEAFDRPGLLRDVTNVLVEDGLHVTRADTQATDEPPHVRLGLTVRIRDLSQLNRALQRLIQLNNVLDAMRAR